MKKLNYLIGSWPLFPQGWHFIILLKPKEVPLINPNLIIASFVYSEQVGKNLQLLPNKGEIRYLYKLNALAFSLYRTRRSLVLNNTASLYYR